MQNDWSCGRIRISWGFPRDRCKPMRLFGLMCVNGGREAKRENSGFMQDVRDCDMCGGLTIPG